MKLELRGLSARHPAAPSNSAPAIANVDLAVASGEQVAVIGPSGAGKTTLLHALACALKPSAGVLAMDGIDPWTLRRGPLQRQRGRLFLAPQVPPLPPRQRVVTAVLAGRLPSMGFWRSLQSLFHPIGMAQAHAALARFDMQDKLFDRVDRLSGGERQRVGLARSLLSDAKLLLVDEPLSALDPARSEQAIASLTQAARESSATLVCTLHHVEMALRNFPRILGLRGGALLFDLPAGQVTQAMLQDLYRQHPEELHGAAPASPDVRDEAGTVRVALQCR